jgi:hypothetical protein
MKTSLLLSLLLILQMSVSAQKRIGQDDEMNPADSSVCLTVKGKILNATEGPGQLCKVELITNQGSIETLLIQNGKRNFQFKLKRNESYTIRISKDGYLNKLIAISTFVPFPLTEVSEFSFNTQMISIEDAQGSKNGIYSIPIAFIRFDRFSESFVYDLNYATQVKMDIYSHQSTRKSQDVLLANCQ